jgi:hypothetical protein
VVVRYAHAIDALDRVASVLRRQRVRADAFTAVAAPDGSTAQATIMFESTDQHRRASGGAARPADRRARCGGVER